jgi:(1->4)-alpha-D-glucan 1-alpha-D-glucosylmutase
MHGAATRTWTRASSTFLQRLLTGDLVAEPRSGFSRQAVLRFAMRVQQYSGPVMAKGLEDTAFYRYNRLVALNEVGGHPDHVGLPLPAFHKANAQRAKRWPQAMLSTSTHDTKRGEDVRARLLVLSEMPEEWARQVRTWSRILRARRGDVEGTAPPDRNDEYLFYQLLLGAWPPELTGTGLPPAEAVAPFVERLQGAMTKSLREGKERSSWAAPNTPTRRRCSASCATRSTPARPPPSTTPSCPSRSTSRGTGCATAWCRSP